MSPTKADLLIRTKLLEAGNIKRYETITTCLPLSERGIVSMNMHKLVLEINWP